MRFPRGGHESALRMFSRRLLVQLQKAKLQWPQLLIVLTSSQFLSMLLLTSQQTLMPLLVRSATKDKGFIASTSVFLMEVMKISACLMAIFCDEKGKIKQFTERIKEDIWYKRIESMKVSVPAFVYALQNNLYYVALANIDATTYSVTYQLRILTTALLAVLLLGKKLSGFQWLALFCSLSGVVGVQLDGAKTSSSGQNGSLWIGVTAVVSMCWTSAFAGVYFEKMLKQPDADIWTQNLRLSLMTLLFAGGGMALGDRARIRDEGFFHGWTPLVWTITIINSVGGLAVSLVMKYADNVKKTYCQSVAIGATALISIFLGDRQPTALLLSGVWMVVVSVYVYASFPVEDKKYEALKTDEAV